jgi:hypothetical protein
MTYLFYIIETNNGSLFDIDAKSANEGDNIILIK